MAKFISICNACNKKIRIPSEFLNKKIKCPICKNSFIALNFDYKKKDDHGIKIADINKSKFKSTARVSKGFLSKKSMAFFALSVFLFCGLFICFRLFFTKNFRGEEISWPEAKNDFKEYPLSNIVNSMTKTEKDKLQNDVSRTLIDKMPIGNRFPSVSNQAKSINMYMNVIKESLIPSSENFLPWMNDIIVDIPEWEKYFYNYQKVGDKSDIKKSFALFLEAIEKKELSLTEAAEDLTCFIDAPVEINKNLIIPLAWIQEEALKIANNPESKLDGAVLFYLSRLLSFYSGSQSWYNTSLKILREYPLPDDSAKDIQYAYCLIRGLRLANIANEKADSYLFNECKKAAYRLMMRLEPDGSPSQIPGMYNRKNLRETLYFASKIFDMDDLRFVAFNGLKNADIYPPSKLSEYFSNTNTYILRNSWNISWSVPNNDGCRKFQDWLGDDCSQLTIEMKSSSLYFFAFNKPQMIIELPDNLLMTNDFKAQWGVKKVFDDQTLVTDIISSDSLGLNIFFIREASAWILESKDTISSVKLSFYKTDVELKNGINNTNLITYHRGWESAYLPSSNMTGTARKNQGNVCVESDGKCDAIENSEKPKVVGYHRKVVLNELTYLIVVGRTLFYENDKDRKVFGDKRERTVYFVRRKERGKYVLTSRQLGVVKVWSEKD